MRVKKINQIKLNDFNDLNQFKTFKENLITEIANLMLFH